MFLLQSIMLIHQKAAFNCSTILSLCCNSVILFLLLTCTLFTDSNTSLHIQYIFILQNHQESTFNSPTALLLFELY
ncbi:hypothetical protein EB796_020332 [Bugula neritina]|uniref:Uncharacterized protein n=1 Tax=Bugula neritina TaxID=10212 RepID=A0A7J7J5R6_BUGNE|nr:hypothetical protein EB796_020332 [Bugula neritina]